MAPARSSTCGSLSTADTDPVRGGRVVRWGAFFGAGALALAGCSGPNGVRSGTVSGSPEGLGLVALAPVRVEISREDRPAGAPRDAIPVKGPWRLVGSEHGIRSYEAPLPLRPRALFYERAPDEMELRHGPHPLRYAATAFDTDRPGTWAMTQDSLSVRLRPRDPVPGTDPADTEGYTLRYAPAQEREALLYRGTDPKVDDLMFSRRSAQVGETSREGYYLPAPSRIAWDVTVPAGGVLALDAGILPPEVAEGTTSDGAELAVHINDAVVHHVRVFPGAFQHVKIPLGAWAGQQVRLALSTQDGETLRDHVFVGAPSIYVPSARPRRVVLAFVDTLRRDHVGVYGYGRPTTPAIDAWARDAVVFEDARTVAPWTLPSTRSLLTGRAPEDWADAPTLQEILAGKGWATGAYVGNVYLSSNFEMSAGWGEHGCLNWPPAELEVARARDFLARNADRDSLLMVHFMDLHLPYKEPPAYRGRWAGKGPPGLPDMFNRNHLVAAASRDPQTIRTYLRDRYDQNLAYVDDQLGPFLQTLGDDATVVFFADHGEEFWDHGDFEHGHSFYDEILRVPLVVKSPGLAARRVTAPVSLVDVTPTVLDLLGMGDEAPDAGRVGAGHSLVASARGEDDPALAGRVRAFGRLLYGAAGWGAVTGTQKYVTRGGVESLHDLGPDPTETRNLRFEGGDPLQGREALAGALGTSVVQALRITPQERRAGGPWTVTLRLPVGIERWWVSDDPTEKSEAGITEVDSTTLRVVFGESKGINREVFVQPKGSADEALADATVTLDGGGEVPLKPLAYDGTATPLARMGRNAVPLFVTWAVMPVPTKGQTVTRAVDAEMSGALEALGYMDRAP